MKEIKCCEYDTRSDVIAKIDQQESSCGGFLNILSGNDVGGQIDGNWWYFVFP
jgi:hypothetical protein